MKLPGTKKNTVSCPRCRTPVSPDIPFCENCGARVAPPPSCTLCGTLLEPGSRFCPSCGAMVGNSKDNLPERAEDTAKDPAPPRKPRAAQARKQKPAEVREKGPDPLMMIPEPDEPASPAEPAVPAHDSLLKKKAPVPSALVTIPPSGTLQIPPTGFNAGKGAVIAIVIIVVAAAVLAFSGVLHIPVLPVSGGDTALTAAALVTTPPVTPETTSVPETILTEIPVTTTEAGSLVPGPTQVPPDIFLVYFQAEREPISKMVTVTYMGGKGQMGVRDVFVRLTRSDGQVLTETFKPSQVGSGVEFQGTEKADRIEVIVHYHTGDEYTVIDKVFEYKKRN